MASQYTPGSSVPPVRKRQKVERRLLREVQELMRFKQSSEGRFDDNYDEMIASRFEVLGELERSS